MTKLIVVWLVVALNDLDDELHNWFVNMPTPEQTAQRQTYLRKYYHFCANTGTKVFPITLLNLCRYAVWLPQNNIKSGWEGVKNYIGAVSGSVYQLLLVCQAGHCSTFSWLCPLASWTSLGRGDLECGYDGLTLVL